MTLEDDPVALARQSVEHLFARCVLGLQAYELLMKSTLARHRFSGPVAGIEESISERTAKIQRMTMGSLVSDTFGSFLAPMDLERPLDEPRDAGTVVFGFQLALPPEEFARIEVEHRHLVLLRNDLVHHFLERYDLRTLDGCLVARQDLSAALDRVKRAREELNGWVSSMENSLLAMASILSSPEVREKIFLPRAVLERGLHEAAIELAIDEWTQVDKATLWLAKRYPDEKPMNYGCKSMRQVIHESGQFELKVREVNGRRQAWYRARRRTLD